jgi:ribosomal protein S12 methylthiotransferase accessory factor
MPPAMTKCPVWDKACSAEETVERALLSLKRVLPSSSLAFKDADLPLSGVASTRFSDGATQTSGKGLTRYQCHASAIMEYVERYSWLHFDYQSRPDYFVGTWHEAARRGTALPPPDYFLHNYPVIPDREALTARILDIPLQWIEGSTHPDGEPYLYPINWHNYQFGSNGLCAGNTAPEALIQGECELIERENIYRLFALREPGIRLDLSDVHCPALRNLLDEATAAGFTLTLLDLSYDSGKPTFIARGIHADSIGTPIYQGVGSGTHPDPDRALTRAITEYFEGWSQTREVMAFAPSNTDWAKTLKSCAPVHGGFCVNYNSEMLDAPPAQDPASHEPQTTNHEPLTIIDITHPVLQIPAFRVFSPTMRSVINTDFYSPYRTIAAALHDAGRAADADAALQHFYLDEAMRVSTTPWLTPRLPNVSAKHHFGATFQQTFQAIMQQRHAAGKRRTP